MKFRVYFRFYPEDDSIIDAPSERAAAVRYCEEAQRRGQWSGDKIPETIEVHVLDDASGRDVTVEVHPEYAVTFYAGKVLR